MAKKYFLGSVGTAEAFRMDKDGKLQLAFRSKTLTDSGLNISTTKDDIRAGTGAPIQFSFYHDPSVEITLTDVLFNEAYVEAQLGTEFHQGGPAYFSSEKDGVTSRDGTVTLSPEPVTILQGCMETSEHLVWYTESGKDEWKKVAEDKINDGVISGLEANKTYCFRWLANDADARVAEIYSNLIPQELFLIITAPIFAGDACSASSGKAAGSITFEIPRFKLNGAQDFTMNMSSNQTMSLSGVALASESGCDTTNSRLLRIIAKYEDLKWYDGVTQLIPDAEYDHVGDVPHFYAIYDNGSTKLVDNEDLDFAEGAVVEGVWAAEGEQSVSLKARPEIAATLTVEPQA